MPKKIKPKYHQEGDVVYELMLPFVSLGEYAEIVGRDISTEEKMSLFSAQKIARTKIEKGELSVEDVQLLNIFWGIEKSFFDEQKPYSFDEHIQAYIERLAGGLNPQNIDYEKSYHSGRMVLLP